MLQRETYIREIVSRLSWMQAEVQLRNSLNLYDLDIHAEVFFCELLNLVFGWSLIDLNRLQKNYVSIDLGDCKNRVAVQVTAQNTRDKVKKTLGRFLENGYEKDYDRLIVLMIGRPKPNFVKPFDTGGRFCFDASADVWDMCRLTEEIGKKPDEELSRIFDFLRSRLCPGGGYAGTDLTQTGRKMLQEWYDLCKAKLLSIGIGERLADEVIESDVCSAKYQYILDAVKQGKRYLTGEFGSGKSHALLILSQRLMREYLSGHAGIFPFYAQGTEIARAGSVRQWLDGRAEKETACFLMIDGLDEMGRSATRQMMEELRLLSVQRPQMMILAAGRPQAILTAYGEGLFSIRPFTDEECVRLYNLVCEGGGGEQIFRFARETLRETLRKPFFCIAFALLKSESEGWIRRDIDLIAALVRKAMYRAGEHSREAYADLARIAAKAVDRNYGAVHMTELRLSGSIEYVLATGFVLLSDDYLTFPLPVIVQWMAAEAIRLGFVNVDEILSDHPRMDQWLYSLSILFCQITYEESHDFFAKIVRSSPGTAARIIRDGVRFDAMTDFPDALTCGKQLQETMQVWVDALGPLSRRIAPVDENGLLPLGIAVDENQITYSWMRREGSIRPVQVLSFAEMRQRGGTIYFRRVPAQATWPWSFTFERLSDRLKKAVKDRTLIPCEGQLQEEYLWDLLLHLSGKGELYEGELDAAAFEPYRQYVPCTLQVNGRRIDTGVLFTLLDRRMETGGSTFAAPYPVSDRPNEAGWVWSGYSAERFLEKTRYVYTAAVCEYMRLVDAVFDRLRDSLPTAMLFPFRLAGRLCFSEDDRSFSDSPWMTWYVEALPEGEAASVEIEPGELQADRMELLDSLIRNNRRLRPDMEQREIAGVTSQYVDICNAAPVTNVVFSWLERELKGIGWID